uniref:Uncharacterized protein n=1 Tax=Hyaloperonospora arabidopsidis (strain Emoy2) TaxID=559515 RepID=M4BEK7_HYAAE
MPQRVAVLSHVKASSTKPSRTSSSSSVRRIAWHGGKISSNKTEALQKFYQRKLRAGDYDLAQQIETTLNVEPSHNEAVPKHLTKTKYQESQVTGTAMGKYMVLKTGRVLGPKMHSKSSVKKADGTRRAKQHDYVQNPVKTSRKSPKDVAEIPLEDKLGLPLHALVGDKAKRTLCVVKRR